MSKMKGIAENLLEVVAYYPNMTADYDVEFFPCDFKVYEVEENGKCQSEISDLGFIHVILSSGETLHDVTEYFTVSEETGELLPSSIIISQGKDYPYNLFCKTIEIPYYYDNKYYKVILDLGNVLENDTL